ncbi:hypothetical protein V7S43_016951 [Phytophthora oleae]|uniref:Uncharacterized protein n=1 Tax=Phytophthora oleae TaxID=2107226 RepID=A0ABD3EUB5_9STRA
MPELHLITCVFGYGLDTGRFETWRVKLDPEPACARCCLLSRLEQRSETSPDGSIPHFEQPGIDQASKVSEPKQHFITCVAQVQPTDDGRAPRLHGFLYPTASTSSVKSILYIAEPSVDFIDHMVSPCSL